MAVRELLQERRGCRGARGRGGHLESRGQLAEDRVVGQPGAAIELLSKKARVRFGAGADAPLERRLEVLEQNVDRLQEKLDDEIRDLSAKIERTEEGLPRTAVFRNSP